MNEGRGFVRRRPYRTEVPRGRGNQADRNRDGCAYHRKAIGIINKSRNFPLTNAENIAILTFIGDLSPYSFHI